jgi:glutaredoxin
MAKAWLTEHGVDFTDIDVSTDEQKAQEIIEKTKQMGVPVIIVNQDDQEEIVVGFDEAKLKKALKV